MKARIAFTLIELLVVIAIIGILSGLIVVTMNEVTQKATIAKSQVFSNSLRNALMMNIVGEWKFDELVNAVNGTTVQDSWGNINSGTLSTNSVSADANNKVKTGNSCVSGSCLQFDGIDDHIILPMNNNTLMADTSSTYTYSFWIKVNQYNTGGNTYVEIYGNGISGATTGHTIIQVKPTAIQILFNSQAQFATVTNNLNEWMYFDVEINRPGAHYKIYKNGTLLGQGNFTTYTPLTNRNPTIGKNAWTGNTNDYFNGLIDDVRLYNAAIPVAQIKEQYYAGLNNLLASGDIDNTEYLERIGVTGYSR